MTILLIRHGDTRLNEEKRYQGSTDAPLSPSGRQKLKRADLDPPRVYVSPLLRARETASILFPDAAQIVIPDLAEMDFGDFEGRGSWEMEQDDAYRAWVDGLCLGPCPHGESRIQFEARALRGLRQILGMEGRAAMAAKDGMPVMPGKAPQENLSDKPGDALPVVIVAHGGIQMALLHCLTPSPKTGTLGMDALDMDAAPPDPPDNYYSWQLPSGHGYILDACFKAAPAASGSPGQIALRILGTRDFNQGHIRPKTEAPARPRPSIIAF